MMRVRYRLLVAFAVIPFCVTACSTPPNKDAAPEFELTSIDGAKISLSQFKGKVVLVDFWAVGCMPCRASLPHLKALHETYQKNGFTILAVNAWDEPPEAVKEFARQMSLPFTVLVNGGKVFKELYKGGPVPMGVLIDAEGNIVFRHIGIDKDSMLALDKKLKELMG
jgi:thiol-disulfide isomerase/thioredoxin